MPLPVDFTLYLITDRNQVPAGQTLLDVVEAALRGGVKAVQLREKDLTAEQLLPLASELRVLTRIYGARLLVNDQVVALGQALEEANGVVIGHATRAIAPGEHVHVHNVKTKRW